MKNQYTAIIEDGGDGWFWARCAEVRGANGQGRTPEEAKEDLALAIELMLEVLREQAEEEMSATAFKDVVYAG